MNKRYRKLAADFLDLASDEFGNHGCNDVDDSIYEGWTKRQRQAFVKAYHEWNGDSEEYDPEWLDLPDFAIMGFLSHLLSQTKEIE